MKVRLTLDVDAHTRYVVAKYFLAGLGSPTRKDRRSRATRKQVAQFARAALKTADRRSRTRAAQLRTGEPTVPLRPPAEKELPLPW